MGFVLIFVEYGPFKNMSVDGVIRSDLDNCDRLGFSRRIFEVIFGNPSQIFSYTPSSPVEGVRHGVLSDADLPRGKHDFGCKRGKLLSEHLARFFNTPLYRIGVLKMCII